ncbi:MAG TPA: 4a-hydroxytetrahydrobiopterin dehydratase [Bdellovibrionota bacterium]|nr:4a-hydroxytetrahydrobiopterin dehydratase [Bdellovibrionota bacterium]
MNHPPVLKSAELEMALTDLPGWKVSGVAIQKTFKSQSFMEGISKMVEIARLAEELDHHPDMFIHYRDVTFSCWTHVSGGVTAKDIDLAHRVERIWAG